MLYDGYPDHLVFLLCVGGIGGIACLSALLAGFVASDLNAPTPTQQARYVWLAFAIPISAIFLYKPLHNYGYAASTEALAEIRHHDVVFGWFVTVSFYLQLASPVLTFLVGLWVYFKPARYAKRRHGRYVTTEQVRLERKVSRTNPWRS